METKNYLLSEKNSDVVFAVIAGINVYTNEGITRFREMVKMAIEENECDPVEITIITLDSEIRQDDTTIYLSVNCIEESEEQELRYYELNLVCIY